MNGICKGDDLWAYLAFNKEPKFDVIYLVTHVNISEDKHEREWGDEFLCPKHVDLKESHFHNSTFLYSFFAVLLYFYCSK